MKFSRFLIVISALGLTDLVAKADTIKTLDGQTYENASVQSTEPDGILVNFQPQPGGIGLAKLKFHNLSEALQKQYGYDAQRAAAFEQQQSQAQGQWRAQLGYRNSFRRYRELAELNRSLGGDASTFYSVSMDANGDLVATGYTGSTVPYTTFPGWPNFQTGPQPDGNGQHFPAPR